MKKYKAVLRATQGLLLGGVKVHESGLCGTREEAEQLLYVYVKSNDECGRHHDGGKIIVKWSKKCLK